MKRQTAGLRWRKSSHSTDTGGQCVEIASVPVQWQNRSQRDNIGGACVDLEALAPAVVEWQKSIRSTDTGGQCVEVADLASAVAVRDSKDPDGPKLVFGAGAWSAFAARAKGGQLDLT